MEDEIDLRLYIEILLRHWKWIAGLTLIAAIAGLVVSLLLPAVYEASAVVLVTQPRYQMQFDPRFEATNQWTPAYRAFPTLATSDGVLQEIVDNHVPSPEANIEEWRLKGVRGMVKATSGGDPSLVLLEVRSRSPEDAAAIANMWADILTRTGNELYGGSEREVAFFEAQVSEAAQKLETAETAMIEFQGANLSSVLEAQLNSYRQAQADYLGGQRTIAYIIQDIQGLREQLAEQADNQSTSLADALTALLLQIKAFNAEQAAPLQIQVESSESLSEATVAEQIAFLEGLVARLQAKSAEIDERLSELEPQILTLQQQTEEFDAEYGRLNRARNLASETYMTLARKLDEAHIAAQEEDGTLQVGSYAAVPQERVGARKLLVTAVAGMLGLTFGIVSALLIELWRQPRTPAPSEQ
jgi:uncharacterized protein involved in exopolysaccharide biosynthesis